MYEPSALRKKPSGLRRSHTANAFRKGVPNHGINFKDAYRNCPIADNYLFTEETTTQQSTIQPLLSQMFTQKSRVFSKIFTSSNWTALLVAGPTLIYTVDTRADSPPARIQALFKYSSLWLVPIYVHYG